MTTSLEIRLLGPFDVSVEGRPVEISGTKRQALLAMLALSPGRVVGVDALIDALWGAELPSSPRNAVQHHVARIRAAVGREAIAASPEGYALPEAEVDAERFERLRADCRSRGSRSPGDPGGGGRVGTAGEDRRSPAAGRAGGRDLARDTRDDAAKRWRSPGGGPPPRSA